MKDAKAEKKDAKAKKKDAKAEKKKQTMFSKAAKKWNQNSLLLGLRTRQVLVLWKYHL